MSNAKRFAEMTDDVLFEWWLNQRKGESFAALRDAIRAEAVDETWAQGQGQLNALRSRAERAEQERDAERTARDFWHSQCRRTDELLAEARAELLKVDAEVRELRSEMDLHKDAWVDREAVFEEELRTAEQERDALRGELFDVREELGKCAELCATAEKEALERGEKWLDAQARLRTAESALATEREDNRNLAAQIEAINGRAESALGEARREGFVEGMNYVLRQCELRPALEPWVVRAIVEQKLCEYPATPSGEGAPSLSATISGNNESRQETEITPQPEPLDGTTPATIRVIPSLGDGEPAVIAHLPVTDLEGKWIGNALLNATTARRLLALTQTTEERTNA